MAQNPAQKTAGAVAGPLTDIWHVVHDREQRVAGQTSAWPQNDTECFEEPTQ